VRCVRHSILRPSRDGPKLFRVDMHFDDTPAFPRGFRCASRNCGLKADGKDLALFTSDTDAVAAAVFTRNQFPGAPVILGRETIKGGVLRAIVANSKVSNVATGAEGLANARRMAAAAAKEIGTSADRVLVSSTGVIGRRLPIEKIEAGLVGMSSDLQPDPLVGAAGIMTTDTHPKATSARVAGSDATITWVAKGSGMIEPNMATMLVYLMTDAELPKAALRPMLRRVVDRTFNSMSIDTDTSTSDTVVLMANGLAGKVKLAQFEKGLLQVSEYLTRELARSGEGATKLITVDVKGAETTTQAKRVAKCVVNSPLVKTAVYGCDPNWGRVIMAVGKSFDPSIDPAKVTIRFGATNVFKKGSPVDCDLEALRKYLGQPEVSIGVDLGIGKASVRVWGCDLTEGYIKENAYYTT